MPRPKRAPAALIAAVAVAALAVASCGGEGRSYDNQPRPPAEITVGVSINKDEISVSPRAFGAGPVNLKIVNQTDRSHQVVLETEDAPGSDGAGLRQETGPINPAGTATIAANVAEGTYRVSVDTEGISPATLDVGDERPSSQQDLLLP